MDSVHVKVCNTCKKELPIRLFHKQRNKKGQITYRGKCAVCYSKYRREKFGEKFGEKFKF